MKKYYIKERLMAIGSKFDVYDERNREVYLVEADKFDIGKNISIYTEDKSKKLLYLEQKIRFGAHKYEVFNEEGTSIGIVEKEFMSPSYKFTGNAWALKMEGKSILGRSYKITKDGSIVSSIEKEFAFGRDRYCVEAFEEGYDEILIGLTIIVDMVRFHSDGN